MASFWKTMTGGLLFTLSLALLGWAAEEQGSGQRKKQISGRTPVNLGQERDIWKPLVQSTTNLSEVHSIRSVFQFRTFDPEGVILYGDTTDGQDWFMLSLRDGTPEMQISKEGTVVCVAGGPKLNDGKWHLLELSNQGEFVILEVNKSKALVVGLGSKRGDDLLSGKIRLALGGVLVDTKKMIVQFQPQMDGCVQEGSWLNLTTPWETEAEELWPCYQNIQPGSYFPGTGFAVFNTSVFSLDTEQDGLKIEIWGHFSQMDGTILSMRAPGQELLLALEADNNTKAVTLTFGNDKIGMAEDLNRLALIFQKDLQEVLIESDQSEARRLSVASEEQPAYLATLAGGRLAIGGLLGEGEEHVGSHYLTGCLLKIQVQGRDLDLDLAVKHASVSSYSCPA